MYTWHMIGYLPSFYAQMHLLTIDIVQRQQKVKSGGTAPEVDGYGPQINNRYGAFH